MRYPDGMSLKHTYIKTFDNDINYNGWNSLSLKGILNEKVSLRDIGIRQPIVHFDLNCNDIKNRTGIVKGKVMSTMSSMRRISEELARTSLTDVDRTDENSHSFFGSKNYAYDRKMSSGSVLSDSSRRSDELRKKRLSDASLSANSYSEHWRNDFEPRRPSDASVVLTQDTDQFIIGDRVWVGGLKPGQIAYIGETQFAPGEWAGVVLDEPIGKNDGTVANIRYFQCEPKKGIFSRLTRLTRYPLVEGSPVESPIIRSTLTESRKSNGSLFGSVPKKSSLTLTPTNSTTSSLSKLPSPDSALRPNIVVGDRVIVKSSQGSKAGILRYLGTTDFAAGEWCGVELDDPLGKNDGSVGGTRYFECRPKFGLFAPLHKVSKSPANKRPSQANCAIHRGGGTANIRRQGSKESLVSLSSTTSTTASVKSTSRKIGVRTPTTPTSVKNALQESLKEKELHIEHLLKERDLERAEVTRAASQADEAERQLTSLKQEFEQHKVESEARITDLNAMIRLLKSENEDLTNQLEDEKKKNEDLQFRFEEELIEMADIKSMSIKYEEKMKMLEKSLFEERKRVEALGTESNKLFEAEEQLVILKDELDSVKEEINTHKMGRSEMEQARISLEAQLTAARAEIESLKIENQSLMSTTSETENELKQNLAKAIQRSEELKKDLENEQLKAEQLAKMLSLKEESISEKEKEIHAKYLKIINELTEKHKTEALNLSKQCEDIKSYAEKKINLLETQLKDKIESYSALETKFNEVNIQLSENSMKKLSEENKQKEIVEKLQNEIKIYETNLQEKNQLLKTELEKSEKFLKEKEKLEEEMLEAKKLLAAASESADKQVSTMNEVIAKQKQDLDSLKTALENKSVECESTKKLLSSSSEEYKTKLEEFENIIKNKDSNEQKLKEELNESKKAFDLQNVEIKKIYESNEENFKSKIKTLENVESEKKKEIELISNKLENTIKLLETKENELKNEQSDNKSLKEKLGILEINSQKVLQENDRLKLEVGDTARKLQAVEEKLNQVTNQKKKLESDISDFINSSNDSSLQLNKLNEDLRVKEKEIDELRESISQKTQHFERSEQEMTQILGKQKEELASLKDEYAKLKAASTEEIITLKNNLEESCNALKRNEDGWVEKMKIFSDKTESQIKNLNETIVALEKKENENKKKYEENAQNFIGTQSELNKKLKETEAASNESKMALENEIQKLIAERKNLQETVKKFEAELVESTKNLSEKANDNARQYENEIEKLKNNLKEAKEKYTEALEELGKSKDEKNKLNAEKLNLESSTSATNELLKQIQVKNAELEAKMSSIESENINFQEIIKQLKEEKCELDKDSTTKMMQLTELKSQLEALSYSKKIQEIENEVKIKNLESEALELQQKLQKTEATLLTENSDKVREIEFLKEEIGKLKQDSSQVIADKLSNIENANIELANLKKKLNDYQYESERKSEQMNKLEKSLQIVKQELESEKKRNEEYGKRLSASETERIDLKERFEEQSKVLAEKTDLKNKLNEISQKLSETEKREQEAAKNSKIEKESLEKMLESSNGLLSKMELETKSLTKEIETLKEEKINLINNNKILAESFEKEKKEMQNKFQEITLKAEKVSNPEDANLEEREFAKGQVDFLNSVIVDMQKKNDALKARIEILEMGFSPEDVDEFNLHNINTRSVAPRLFCDICDRFDLHDTEDCPTQAMEDVPPPKSSKGRVLPPERPFCEICEVFGHDTADCDEGETF